MKKINKLTNEALVEAGSVATMKDIYVYSIIGAVLRGLTTKSVVKGINYGIWGLGAQIIINVSAQMIATRVGS